LTNEHWCAKKKDALAVFDRLLLFPDFCAFLQADEHLEWQELFSRRKEVEIVAEEIE